MAENDRMTEKVNNEGSEKNKRRIWRMAFFFLLCMQVLTLLYFGNKKAGFHEDEYYSYYSTNRTAGLREPDREWVEREDFYDEFVVKEGEGFRYGLVATVQSWDVHPPFFYFILHTACSLFPGVFSKWLGIGVNILAFVINFLLLIWLGDMVTNRNKPLTFAITAAYGFNAVIISGVMFIRMYEWLTVFVLLCACLHVRAVKRNDLSIKSFLLPLMAVTYLGFLTQYYYIIFLFFIAFGFCLWLLWRDRKLWNCLKYGAGCAAALLLAVISYPASLSHIFRGYRGTGAASEFLNTANTGERLGFFTGLMNDYLFDGFLWLWIAVIAVMAAILFFLKKKSGTKPAETENTPRKDHGKSSQSLLPCLLLLIAAGGYFFTVSKTALLLYETSNRYQIPIYGILLLLVFTALYEMGKRIAEAVYGGNRALKIWYKAAPAVLLLLFLMGDMHELLTGKVIFLYEEEGALVEYAKENAHQPVIILYNDATPYHVWWCAQELMQYDRVYFASEANQEKIEDRTICGSDKIIVYAADYETKEKSLDSILESNPGLSGYELVAQKSLWSVYEFK